MTDKPAIIVISSHVVRGTVGNRAAAFALEVLGFPVWCIPTVTLPWHPGHGPAHRIVAPDNQFATLLDDVSGSAWLGEVGAILSGYLGSATQVGCVGKLVSAVKARNPDALYALDPVIGDGGSLYVPEEQAIALRDDLLPRADLVTPNQFELAWLARKAQAADQSQVAELAKALGTPMVLATSAPAMMRGMIGNMLLHDGKAYAAEHRMIEGPPNGLGDLTAALMVAHLLGGTAPHTALQNTTSSVYEVMIASARAGSDELAVERNIRSLLQPSAPMQMRQLHLPSNRD